MVCGVAKDIGNAGGKNLLFSGPADLRLAIHCGQRTSGSAGARLLPPVVSHLSHEDRNLPDHRPAAFREIAIYNAKTPIFAMNCAWHASRLDGFGYVRLERNPVKNLAATHRSLWHGSRPRPATGFCFLYSQFVYRDDSPSWTGCEL